MAHDIYRDGKVHVCDRECSTCVFRKGNLMHLRAGRLRGMIEEAVEAQSAIVCHKTLSGENAACRGFFDRHRTGPLQIAERLGMIEYVEAA
jgi:hypothetical protein